MEKPSSEREFKPAIDVNELLGETEQPTVESLVMEKLNPRGEIDRDGFGREVYSFEGQTISFRNREEMPIYPTAESSNTEVLGSSPKNTEAAAAAMPDSSRIQKMLGKYEDGLSELKRLRSPEKPTHYSVDRSLEGVSQLLTKLRPESQEFAGLAEEVASGEYSDQAIDILDKIAAVASIDPSTGERREQFESNAEMVVVLSLLGDAEASSLVAKSLEALHKIDQASPESSPASTDELKDIADTGLMVIHSTKYAPQTDATGLVATRTLFDATGTHPRASIHTSLNHKVEGHIYGDWSDAGHIVVAQLEDMVEANGKPTNLSGVDTWWSRNPGEALHWQNATVISPGGDIGGEPGLAKVEGDRILVKTENYTIDDIKEMIRKTVESGAPTRDLHTLLEAEQLEELRYMDESAVDAAAEYIMSTVAPSLMDGEDIRQHAPDYQGVENLKQGIIREAVQRAVLNDHLRKRGKDVFTGGMWASSGEDRIRALAGRLELSSGPHTGSIDAGAEALPEEDSDINYHTPAGVLAMNPKVRRVLYASGVRQIKYRTPNVGRINTERSGGGLRSGNFF